MRMRAATTAYLATTRRHATAISRTTSGVIVTLLFAVPIAYALVISIEDPSQFIRDPLRPGKQLTLNNYGAAWQQADLAVQLANTVLYAVVGAALIALLSLLVALPIARRYLRGGGWIYSLFVIGLCFSMPIIPMFVEAQMLHLYDNRLGYILLHLGTGMPLGVILLASFIRAIPRELDEAAVLDGVGYTRYVVSIVIPLALPSLTVTFLYSLLSIWNDIIGPIVFLADPGKYPVTRGVFQFFGSNSSAWTTLCAAIVIISLPVTVLFATSQRVLVKSAIGASA